MFCFIHMNTSINIFFSNQFLLHKFYILSKDIYAAYFDYF